MATVNKDFKVKNGIQSNGTIIAPAATTSLAPLRIPHGTAPSAPTDGDIWTTTTGLFFRMNGNTRTIADTTVGTLGGLVNINAGTGAVTQQIAYGATTSGTTKTINIGPNGLSGSTTNINIGSAISGATTTTVLNGNAVVGPTTPKVRFQVTGIASDPPTLGTASGTVYFTPADSAYGLLIGTIAATGDTWLQAQRTDTTATAYDILLNPSGGNVGIGKTNPATKLDISGVTTIDISDNQLLLHSGSTSHPTVIFRNDASNFYMLLSAAGTTPSGTWNTLRPFYINLSTGLVSIDNGLNVTGLQALGTPTAPTATAGTNTTQIATTAFVQTAISSFSSGPDYSTQFLFMGA